MVAAFTVDEMRRLIDALVDECSQLNIPIEDNDYINSLVREWGEHEQRKNRIMYCMPVPENGLWTRWGFILYYVAQWQPKYII